MQDARLLPGEQAGARKSRVTDQRFGIFLWFLSCLAVWVWLARDTWSVLFCLMITGVPTILLARTRSRRGPEEIPSE